MSNHIASTAIILPGVVLGEDVWIEDYCIIGSLPRGAKDGELKTIIGDHAVIRSHTVIYAGNTIGSYFQTGNKTNIRESNVIGNKVSIGTLSIVEHHVRIEDNVRIHSQAFIPEYSILENGCWIGPNVVLTNAKYPNRPDTKENLRGCVIKPRAVVGANSTILPGITVNADAIVGAGSVVVHDVTQLSIVKGNPAR